MKVSLPDGPGEPSFLQVGRYLADPVGHLERCRARFGPVFTLRWPGMPPMVYFTELGAIREIFAAPTDVLLAGHSNSVLDFIAGPRSVARLDGDEHKMRRRALVSPFTRLGPTYAETMVDNTLVALRSSGSGPVSFQQVSQSLSLRNLIGCALGVKDPEAAGELHDLMLTFIHDSLNPVMAAAWMIFPGVLLRKRMVRHLGPLGAHRGVRRLPFVRLSATIAALDAHLLRLIHEARKSADVAARVDVLSLLVHRTSDLADEEVRDEMMALLVAGHETTSTTMDWFLIEALGHPRVHERLLAEVDEVAGGRPITPDLLPRLPYLSATIQECLRLHAPVPSVGRHVARDIDIAGVHLPSGAMVSPSLALLQRDPTLWRDPLDFQPERFLDGAAEKAGQAPFGGGTRTCIGKHFALFQLQVVLATMLQRFTIAPRSWPVTRQVQRGLFTGVSHAVNVVITERK